MNKEGIIKEFVSRHAPENSSNTYARHTQATLARFLNVEPDEITAFCEAGLLQAEEIWPGAPSLRFSNLHLCTLRHELARQHAEDTIELCQGKNDREVTYALEASWEKRSNLVIELSRKV